MTVIYEDANFAVLYKPAHLLCHSDRTGDANLVDAFAAYLEAKGEYDPHAEQRFAPALCNRLDRGTEGLVLAAKSYTASAGPERHHPRRPDEKGVPDHHGGCPARRAAYRPGCSTARRTTRCASTPARCEGYKQIITDVTVIRQDGPFALCRIGLITGRTHQIRAHLAYLGHPVLGDIKYGNRKMNERTGLKTQALCAQRLTFGRIPEENTLRYLSGRVIKLDDPAIVKKFDALTRQYRPAQNGRIKQQYKTHAEPAIAAAWVLLFLFFIVQHRARAALAASARKGFLLAVKTSSAGKETPSHPRL